MKKIFSISLALLAAATLAACANGKLSVPSKSSESKASSSSVKPSSKASKSSPSSSSSSDSSTSSSVNLETPDFVLITDEEIANVRTLGDLKGLYNNLVDNYIRYSKEIREKLPDSEKSGFDNEAQASLQEFEASKQTFSDNLSQYGPDDLEVSAEAIEPYLQRMRETRDKLANILKLSYMLASNASKKQ
ncbi:hypothetical protein STRDD11_00921 [Streptococcus sp. DD11]|uniref:hypothetical protein n=1 Tax=Streptococcus sp. DD11 TaxID=1777879 RepID=UPI00079B65B0|nr:hypothetical protein [Streptococcus sp. DD11]KXT84530.1 hypothetical protein STRDD11_00921 [Streptococcus sp. DD11]